MRNGIKEALLRVTGIMVPTETERSQEVNGHDKACEIFHHVVFPSAAQLYYVFETGWTHQEKRRRRGRGSGSVGPWRFTRGWRLLISRQSEDKRLQEGVR